MTLLEQNVQPDPAVTEGLTPEQGGTLAASTARDPMDMLSGLVGAGWDDLSLAESFRLSLDRDLDEETADRAYQLAKRVVLRERTDEAACELIGVLLEVLERAGWGTEARLIATRVGGLTGVGDALRRRAARILLEAGSVRVALSLIGDLPTGDDRLLAARCHEALGDPEGVFEAAAAALSLIPGNEPAVRVVTLLVGAALSTGRPEAALTALRRVPKAERTRDLLLLETRARELTDDLKGAARPLRLLLERDPTDDTARGHLVDLLSRSGQREAARVVYREGLPFLEARLPDTADELFEEPSRFVSADPAPASRLGWVAGVTGQDPDPWQARELIAFDRTLLAWVQTRPDRIRELTYRVRLSEAAQGMVMDMHLRGRGVLIASAHAGLMDAAPLALLAAGVRFGLTAPATLLDLPGLSDHLIAVEGRSRTAAMRDLTARLRGGEAVAVSADAVPGPRPRRVPLFDRKVPVSDLCARISERLNVPTVFPRVLPGEGGVITVDLRPLPAPSADLSGEPFRDAWARAWASELEDLLRSAPYAMRGTGGFWDAILDA